MGGQYFEKRPAPKRRPAQISVTIRGYPFNFHTDSGVFSRDELDRGTELLLEAVEVGPCETILDLGCGYGVIGIVAARLTEGGHGILTDVNQRAAALARANLAANGIRNAGGRLGGGSFPGGGVAFDHILCNPPIPARRGGRGRIIPGG